MHSREKEKKEKKETDLSGVKWKTNGHPLNRKIVAPSALHCILHLSCGALHQHLPCTAASRTHLAFKRRGCQPIGEFRTGDASKASPGRGESKNCSWKVIDALDTSVLGYVCILVGSLKDAHNSVV
jgi:hypothetical protein